MQRIVIRGAAVRGRPAGGTTVVVEDRHIARIGRAGEAIESRPGDWELEADGRLVVPGGVDAHTHLATGALLRLAGLPGTFPGSVTELRSGFREPLEERLGPAELEALTAAGALAALRAGVTCAVDLSSGAAGGEAEALAAVARGVSTVGLRAALARALHPRRLGPGAEAVRAFAASVAGSSILRGLPGLDGLDGAELASLTELEETASRLGLHASISEDESDLAHAYGTACLRPVQLLGSAGLLGSRTIVAHGSALVSAEATLLGRTGSALVVTPRATLFWGGGFPSLEPLAVHDVPIALGTNGLYPDLAGEAVALAMLLRRAHGGRPPGDLLGHVVWPAGAEIATRLFGDRVGLLEEGALADVVVLDWRPPFPLPDAPEGDLALLWAGAPAAWAIVDGQVRLREGRLLAADEAEIAARAREAAARVLA